MKKKVIAYLHTHWDREWYREFEVFRLRLLRVFGQVLDLLENRSIPSFYFDGQTSAIEDYLELYPEKEKLVKELIKQKKLFIGPCYTLVDEFLTDEKCFRKNLQIGIEYAKKMGCEDFLGYFADTFGHSKNMVTILKEFGIDKIIVWRGCPDELPAEFVYNGIKAVNLIRGYFMDIFSSDISICKKAEFLEDNFNKIAEKSQNVLLLPIGADHLGIEEDIVEQIKEVNKHLKNYEIELSSPFKYFEEVKNNFKFEYKGELRDNTKTFILSGCHSARIKLKQYSAECSYKLDLADKFQEFAQKKYKTKSYKSVINYAYKLLLQNLAHDGICGCSTDSVHRENILRYEKVLQISNAIIKEIIFETGEKSLLINLSDTIFNGIIEFESKKDYSPREFEKIGKRFGFEDKILYDISKIPITEDYKPIYKYLAEIENKAPSKLLSRTHKPYGGRYSPSDLKVGNKKIENSFVCLEIKKGKIIVTDKKNKEIYDNFFELIDFKDKGDTYNFAPIKTDEGEKSKIISSEILYSGELQASILINVKIKNTPLSIVITLRKQSHLFNCKIVWNNKTKNHLLQAKFNLKKAISKTYSKDMDELVERKFNPDYQIRENLPKTKGMEAKTNTAPMQQYVCANGFEVITKGLFEYEVNKNSLQITLLRAIGIISNPKNPARTTPAGPPLEVPEAQQLGENTAEFYFGFSTHHNWKNSFDEVYPYMIMSK